MSTYVLINYACDGTHESVHQSRALAAKALAAMLGYPVELELGQAYYSDWGNRLVVEERGAGHTARDERRLRAAYDARECGTATKAQFALLLKRGF